MVIKNDISSNDISSNDISTNDISVNDISSNDIKIITLEISSQITPPSVITPPSINITSKSYDDIVNSCLQNITKDIKEVSNTTIDNNKREELKNLLDKYDTNFMNLNFRNLKFSKDNSSSIIDNSSSIIVPSISNRLDSSFSSLKFPIPPPPLSFLSFNNDTLINQSFIKDPIIKTKININREINNIGDLLKLVEDYEIKPDIEYNINMNAIHNIKVPLKNLNNMIGMDNLKVSIVDQILFFIQDLHNIGNNDFMHTVISGPPGTGKTEIARYMGQIFCGLGILKYGTFRKATRSDLVAGYLGQTAIKTTNLINECLGGVLFIDEAYALGNKEGRDSFAKEAIDTLCEALSNHKSELMVIIAGYDEELKSCFFNYNKGLQSRFTWRFKTDDYTAEELKQIFIKKVIDTTWSFQNEFILKTSWFETNMKYFKYYGRDMETLFAKTKIAHSRRVFCLDKSEKTILTHKDVDNGLKLYLQNDEISKHSNDNSDSFYKQMYI